MVVGKIRRMLFSVLDRHGAPFSSLLMFLIKQPVTLKNAHTVPSCSYKG